MLKENTSASAFGGSSQTRNGFKYARKSPNSLFQQNLNFVSKAVNFLRIC